MACAPQLPALAVGLPCPLSNTSFARPHCSPVSSVSPQGVAQVPRSQISDDYGTAGGSQVSQYIPQQIVQPANPRQPLPIHPSQQHVQQQRQQQQNHTQKTARYFSRAESLACALQLHPSQTAQMMREYPALSNFNPGSLADKVAEIAGMLQLPPQQVAAVLVSKPRVLGASLQAIEARVDVLVQIFGILQAVRQLVLQDPTWLTWSPKHLRKRLHNMALCLGTDQQELLQLLQQHPQLLDASRWLGQSLGLVQQLLQLAASRQAAICDPKAAAAAAGGGGAAWSSSAQQQEENGSPHAPPDVPLSAVREFAMQNPQLLLISPDQLQARIATMQAQSGLSVNEIAAAVVATPALLHINRNSGSNSGHSRRESSRRRTQDGSASTTNNSRNISQQVGVAEAVDTAEHLLPEASSNHDHSNSNSNKRGKRRAQPGKQYWLGLSNE